MGDEHDESGTPVDEVPEPASLGELRVRGRSLRTWTLGLMAVALAVSGAFGGLRKAEAEVPTVPAGTAVDGGQLSVTVERVTAVRDLKPEYRPSSAKGALIGVVATVRLTDDESVRLSPGAVRLTGVTGIAADKAPLGASSMREDLTRSPMLQPEVPEKVVFIWEIPDAADIPDRVTVEIQQRLHKDEDLLTGRENWFDDGIAARVDVPVKNDTAKAGGS